MKPFETVGEWWEPDRPSVRFVGRLRVHPEEGMDLFLYPTEAATPRWHGRGGITFLGHLGYEHTDSPGGSAPYAGEKVTLGGCEWAGEVRGDSDARQNVHLRVTVALVRAHLPKWEEHRFRWLELDIRGMPEWIGPLGLLAVHGASESYEVKYVPPEVLVAPKGSVRVALRFRLQAPMLGPTGPDLRLRTDGWFEVHDANHTLDELAEEFVAPLHDLVTFATNARCQITTLMVRTPEVARDETIREEDMEAVRQLLVRRGVEQEVKPGTYKSEIPIRVLHVRYMAAEPQEARRPLRDDCVPFSTFRSAWPGIAEQWFALREKASEAIHALLAHHNAKWLYADSDFLFAFQAAESLHAALHDDERDWEVGKKERKARILAAVAEEDRETVIEAMKRLWGPSARDRIEALLRQHDAIMAPLLGTHRTDFLGALLKTRNRYAHRSPGSAAKAAPEHTLDLLVALLRILATAEVLKQMGFDEAGRLRLCGRLGEYQHAKINVEWLAEELAGE